MGLFSFMRDFFKPLGNLFRPQGTWPCSFARDDFMFALDAYKKEHPLTDKQQTNLIIAFHDGKIDSSLKGIEKFL